MEERSKAAHNHLSAITAHNLTLLMPKQNLSALCFRFTRLLSSKPTNQPNNQTKNNKNKQQQILSLSGEEDGIPSL